MKKEHAVVTLQDKGLFILKDNSLGDRQTLNPTVLTKDKRKKTTSIV